MIRVFRKGLEHTGLTTACRVERNLSAAGAQCSVTLICAPKDYYVPKLNPACGDPVEVLLDDSVLFSGTAERVDFSSDGLCVTLTCFDGASRLARCELYAAFAGTPGAIAAQVLERLGLAAGDIWLGAGTVFIPAGCALSGHAIIREAYGKCAVSWREGKVDIVQPGARTASLGDLPVLGGTAVISVSEMVNRAQVIGYQGRTEGVAENTGDIAGFGLRQRVYSLSGARGTARSQAAGHLKGPARQAALRLLGGVQVHCGDSLELGHAEYGLDGRWLVSRVSHEIQAGVAVTALGLEEMR